MRVYPLMVGVGVAGAMAIAGLTGAAIAQEVVPVTPVQVQPVPVTPVQVQPVQPVRVQPVFVRPVNVQVFSVPVPLQPGSIPQQFEREFYSFDGNYFQNRGFLRQLAYLFGPYTENEIHRDGREADQLYREVLSRQLSTGPLIRTTDLASPFTETIGTLPPPQVVVPAPVIPVQPPVIERPVPVVPPVSAPSPAPVAPVPALW